MKTLFQSMRMMLWFTVLTGVIYPLVITVVAQVGFSKAANGSLIEERGKIVGSELLAQAFKDPKYFWPRPSAVDFNPLPSGGSNFGPTSKDLATKVAERKAAGFTHDLLFASASGLDPDVSPEGVQDQAARVGAARHLDAKQIERLHILIAKHIQQRQWGLFGEPRINVLRLNVALDQEYSN